MESVTVTTTDLETASRRPRRGADVPVQRRHARPARSAWQCDNCDAANEGRRRRCGDCGTSRL